MLIVDFLKQSDIFYDLTPAQLELIAALCREQSCRSGEDIFRENSPSREMYVLVSGQVQIQLDPRLVAGSEQPAHVPPATIATLRAGDVFGEIALVDEGVRTATARAIQHDTRLLVIPRDGLIDLCTRYPELGYRLMRNLAGILALKIRSTDIEMRSQLLWRPRQQDLNP